MHSIIRSGIAAAALVAGLAAATAANAAVVFDNTHEPYGAWTSSSGLLGMEFVPSQSGRLESIQLPLVAMFHLGDPHPAVVTLYAGQKTTLLDSWNFNISTGSFNFPGLTVLTPDTPINLIAGDDYWVFLSSPNYFTDGGVGWAWTVNPSGPLYPSYGGGGGGYELPGSPFNDQFNLRVLTAVPEPATWALFILGFGGIGASLRARRERGLAGHAI